MRNVILAALLLSGLLIYKLQAQTAMGDPNATPIEFRWYHTLTPPDSGCGINGAMNQWTGGVYKMKQYLPYNWKVTLDLLPLTYEYKFTTYTDTVGQAGVTAYFTDPLNSRAGGPFNNSYLTVHSPMVYYFLPKDGASTQDVRPLITANISWANSAALDITKLYFSLDGVTIANPSQYFNAATRMFSYQPTSDLSYTPHTALIKIATMSGDTTSLSTVFTVFIYNGQL